MAFEILGEIGQIETIASAPGIRIRRYLVKTFGKGRWRKCKGIATIKFPDNKSLKPKFIGMKRLVSEGNCTK